MMRNSVFPVLLVLAFHTTRAQTIESTSKTYSFFIEKEAHYCEKPNALPEPVLENLQFSDANDNGLLEAGEKCNLRFTLKNRGKGHACRLSIGLKETGLASGISLPQDVVLSELAPGESKTLNLEISGTMAQKTQKTELLLTVIEKNHFDALPVKISVEVQAFQPPQVEIVGEQFSSEKGSLTAGSEIVLTARVQNLGKGSAEDVKLQFELPAQNVFPTNQTEFAIGRLGAGEYKTIEFPFMVNKRYEASRLPVKMLLSEKMGIYAQNKEVSAEMNQIINLPHHMEVKPNENKEGTIEKVELNSDVDRDLPKTSMSNPDAIALVIGNRDYVNTKKVDYALEDASSIRNYLVQVLGYKESNVIFQANADLDYFNTWLGTEKNRGKLSTRVKPGLSDVFIYYCGHGAPDLSKEGGQKGYIVPVKCDPNYVANSGYALETFYRNLEDLPAKSITVVLDACFSGAEIIQQASPLIIKTKMPELKKSCVLASSEATQVSNWYPEKKHGMFTYFLLKVLQNPSLADQNRDNKLTMEEMYQFINSKSEGVPFWSSQIHGPGREQNPVLLGPAAGERVLMEWK